MVRAHQPIEEFEYFGFVCGPIAAPHKSAAPAGMMKIPGGAGGAGGQLMDRAGIHCQSFSGRAVDPNRFGPLITGDFSLV